MSGRAELALADLAQREKHAGRFDHHHEHHHAQRHDRAEVEGRRAEAERVDEREPVGFPHAAEIDHAQRQGHDLADAQADQHGEAGDKAGEELVDDEDRREHQGDDGEVARVAEILAPAPPPAQLMPMRSNVMPITVMMCR